MFYKKKLLIISSILLLLLSIVPYNIVQAIEDVAGTQVDAFYTSLNENQTIQSGETAIYRLDFYASGIDGTSTEPIGLEIKLPENENGKTSLASELEDLKLADQVPVYDETTNSLKYTFDHLTTGQAYNVTLRVNTQNGTIPNGTALKTEAIFTQGDREIVRKAAQVSVTSDTQVALSKTYAYTVGHENEEKNYTPRVGDVVVWKGKLEIPKNEFGLAFIKEGSQIVVSDTIQSGQTYVGARGEGASISRNGATVSLSFPAPLLADQLAAQADPNRTNLFEKEVEIRTRVNNFNGQLTSLKNKLSTSLTNISDKTIRAESNEAQVSSGKPSSTSTNAPNGTIIVGINRGPNSEDGELANVRLENGRVVDYNPNPLVKDTALLSFEMVMRPGYKADEEQLQGRRVDQYYFRDNDDFLGRYRRLPANQAGAKPAEDIFKTYNWVNMWREIDKALILDELVIWEPVNWMNFTQEPKRMAHLPKTVINMTVTDLQGNFIRNQLIEVDWRRLSQKSVRTTHFASQRTVVLTREDLQLSPGERVSKYNVLYQNPNSNPQFSGEFWGNIVDRYTIVRGTNGTVTNKSWVTFDSPGGYLQTGPRRGSEIGGFYTREAAGGIDVVNSTFGARTARITPTTQPNPIIDVAVGLKKADGNVVTAGIPQADGSVSEKGKNRLSLTLTNRHPSLVEATGPISMTASLPPGVTIDEALPNWKVTLYQKNGKEKKIINVDGGNARLDKGKNAQGGDTLIFTWKDPNAKLQVGDRIEVEINANVANTVDPNFTIEGYGNVGNPDFTVPTGALDPIIDTMDIDGDGNTSEKLAVARANYKLADSRDLQIKKLVKGELDKEYSTFGHTRVGGMIDYRLNITNTTGDVIRRMGFMDVLPNLNDTAVTNTTQRGSKFRPSLTGSITVPAEWQDKVTVYYTTVATPSRGDLYAKVDYPEGASQPDAVNAEDPNWQTADTITDWAAVTAFKVELNEGVAWIPGQGIHMDFKMKAPENPDESVTDPSIPEKERAAWNSFSVTTNGLFAVEPEKVGVALEPVVRKHRLKIIKVNEQGEKIPDSKTRFSIKKSKDVDAPVYNGQEARLGQNDGGEFLFDNKRNKFKAGTYYIVEDIAPVGYVKLKEPIELTISERGEVTVQKEYQDMVTVQKDGNSDIIEVRIKNEKRKLTLKKVSETDENQVLSGAAYTLYERNGLTEVATQTTGEDGLLVFEGLVLGKTYKLKEKTAPVGYSLNETLYEIKVAQDGTITVTNPDSLLSVESSQDGHLKIVAKDKPVPKYSLKIVKVDEKDGKIKDATTRFAIRQTKDPKGPVYNGQQGNLRRNGGGEGSFDNKGQKFEPGVYYIHEDKAPDGYMPLPEPIEFTISNTGEYSVQGAYRDIVRLTKEEGTDVIELRVKNFKPGEFPHTGGIGLPLFIGTGLSLMLISGFFLIKRKPQGRHSLR